MQIPILFYGDSPDLRGGLSRIGRDLATLCSSLPEFRVGYFGRGGCGSRQLPFAQYNFSEYEQWGEQRLERAWMDFAGPDKTGIIFTIWDASRLLWFAWPRPEVGRDLHRFLTSGRFCRWGYFPVDANGPSGRLTIASRDALDRYDRLLAYTEWGARIMEHSASRPRTVDWIPHGIHDDVWHPTDREQARTATQFDGSPLIGCVMTNQARKDWGLAFATISELKRKHFPLLKFWAHTDALERSHAWNLLALIHDFQLGNCVHLTLDQPADPLMALRYASCDLTFLPSLGEGFGYPLVESLACGVPVVHGAYGGGAELIPSGCCVPAQAWRLDGPHNCLRPVYDPAAWVEVMARIIEERLRPEPIWTPERCVSEVEHLRWSKLWPSCWKKWFLEGLDKKC